MYPSPLVSVVVPVFNCRPYLAASLDSVLEQDYPAIELIAVDDGSTDGSLELLRSYGDRIRVLEQRNQGPAAARNRGVAEARGEYIAFNDADDVWLPGKLRAQVEHLHAHPDVGIVFSQFAYWWPDADGEYRFPADIDRHPERWEVPQPLSGWIYADMLADSCIAMIVPVLRRRVLEETGPFDESLKKGSDYDFWLRATFRHRVHKIERCFALYRRRNDSVTGRPDPVNFPFMILDKAVRMQGMVGPDGRRADERFVLERMNYSWLEFARVHMRRGSMVVAVRSMWRFLVSYRFRRVAFEHAIRAIGRDLTQRGR